MPAASGAPAALTVSAAACALPPSRSATMTLAPSDPNRFAVASPMPLAAPVMIATLLENLMSGCPLLHRSFLALRLPTGARRPSSPVRDADARSGGGHY